MRSLDDLGVKYKTDKSSLGHCYLEIYEKYFRTLKDSHIFFLEIGIFDGGSLRMWEEYFPQASIYGIDINPIEKYKSNRVMPFVANQEDRESLSEIMRRIGTMDIIIDDGGHTMKQQQISFGYLFQFVKPGGLYVIEDLHTSRGKRCWNRNPHTDKTTLKLVDRLSKDKTVDSDFMLEEEKKYIDDNCSFCKVEMGKQSEIAFIGRKI